MRKYLHITEYSSLIPHKVPDCKKNEHSFKYGESIIRSFIDSERKIIKESFDSIYNDSIITEKSIPIDKIIIFDNIDIKDDEQEIQYVFECPVCLYNIITTDKHIDFCPYCENDKFPPQLIALINKDQTEELTVDNADSTTFIQVKDNNIVFRDESKEKQF